MGKMQSQQISLMMRSKTRALRQLVDGVLPGGGATPGGVACAKLWFETELSNIATARDKRSFT